MDRIERAVAETVNNVHSVDVSSPTSHKGPVLSGATAFTGESLGISSAANPSSPTSLAAASPTNAQVPVMNKKMMLSIVKEVSTLLWGFVFISSLCVIVVSILVSFSLKSFYTSSRKARDDYLRDGSALRLAAVTNVELLSGLENVRDTFYWNIMEGAYSDEFDFETVNIISQSLFSANPHLNSISLAFSSYRYIIIVSRASDGTIFMRSDSPACFSIGPSGCLYRSNDDFSSHDLDWFNSLTGSNETYSEMILWNGPSLVSSFSSTSTSTIYVTSAVSILWSLKFPGISDSWLIGKASSECQSLSQAITDARLMNYGHMRVFLTNNVGVVIGGAKLGASEFLTVDVKGNGQFKNVWDLSGGPDGLSRLSLIDFSQITTMTSTLLVPSVEAVIHPFTEFFRMIVISEVSPFVDSKLQLFLILSVVTSSLPYVAILIVVIIFSLKQRAVRLRMEQRQRDLLEAQLALSSARAKGKLAGAMLTGRGGGRGAANALPGGGVMIPASSSVTRRRR